MVCRCAKIAFAVRVYETHPQNYSFDNEIWCVSKMLLGCSACAVCVQISVKINMMEVLTPHNWFSAERNYTQLSRINWKLCSYYAQTRTHAHQMHEHHFSFGFTWYLIFNMMSAQAVNPTLTWSPGFSAIYVSTIPLKNQQKQKLCSNFLKITEINLQRDRRCRLKTIFWHVANSLSLVIRPQNAFRWSFWL